MDEAQVQRIVEANNAELMRQISTLVSSQVASIKRSADEASTTQIIREIKKIKSADYRPTFNRKSNEEQYKSATRILDTLEEAKLAVASLAIGGLVVHLSNEPHLKAPND